MPKNEIALEDTGATGVDLAKMLATKIVVTVGTIVAVGVVTAIVEKKLEKKA